MKSREQLKEEALLAMKTIKLSPACIKAFKDRDVVWTSERGMLYEDEEYQELVKKVEAEYNGIVYHIDHSIFEFGEVLSMFWVSGYEDETIESTIEDLKDGYAFCYAMNLTDDWCSEFGSIAFKSMFGGVARIS